MKRYLLFLATVALLASCKRSEEPGGENTKDQMRFTANVPAKEDDWKSSTRGQVTDNSNIANFGAFCFNTGRTEWATAAATALPNKMYDVEVARTTATSDWAYNPPVEWLGGDGSLFTFFGYSPRAMGLYEEPDNSQGNNIEMLSSQTDAGVPTVRFTTLDYIPMQVDFLLAKPVVDSRPVDRVQMQFTHALSQIRFKAWAEQDFVRVKSIEISNVSHTATIALDGTITPESGTKTFLLNNVDRTLSTDEANKTDLSDGGNGFMLLPQDLSSNTTAQITVTYEVAGETKTSAPYTLVEKWEASKSYTYILKLGGAPTEEMVVTEVVITDWAIDSEEDMTTSPAPSFIVIDGLRWATGNLVANGANGAKIGAPGDGGLYFQYGGLVGYKGGANGDGTGIIDATIHTNNKFWGGASIYSADEVVVAPASYTNQATWPIFRNDVSNGFGYYYFHSFTEKYKDFQSQSNANQPDLGIGDPCAYYLGGEWRLPKYDELSAITGRTDETWAAWDATDLTGRWEDSGPKSAIGVWFGPSATTNPTLNTDLFIPASGYRYLDDGSFRGIGTDALIFSSSVVSNLDRFTLYAQKTRGVTPRSLSRRAFGHPVRCVSGTYVAPYKPTPPTADQIVEIDGLKWTTGNLVAKDAVNAKVGAPGDGGLYFQHGGLVGYKGGANGDGTGITNATTHPNGKWWNGAAAYSANDVAVKPATYTNQATWPYFNNVASGGFGYYYFNTFVTKYADFQSQANANNPTLGIGDPCAYYLGSPWRLPKYDELSAITGSAVEGSWVPWSTAGVTGKWTNSGPQSTMGAWFGPNSRSGTPTINTDLFIPASGHRSYSDGAFYNVGIEGFLWSSSVYNATNGFYLHIHESYGVIPRSPNYRARAFPVRCVSGTYVAPYKPTPPTADQIVEIDGLKWTTGNLVAKDAVNAKVGAPGDGGLYFQYGGLIGYKGGATGDGTGITDAAKHPNGKWWNGAAAYSAADVAVKPATYLTQATWPYFNNVASGGFGYYYFNDFVTKYADFQSQIDANNPTLGIGDPCAYYLGSPWRLPKYDELSAITGNATEGAWVPWSTAGVTGKWTNSGPQSTMGAWFGPNSRSGTPTVNTDLLIPASGYRYAGDGAFYYVGIYGYLWSSSVYNATHGFALQLHESYGVIPRDWYRRTLAFPVRCVSGTLIPTVEVKGTKWATGNLVADGANGAKIGKPEDGGLYFQFGSLIGWKGGASGDGTGRPTKANNTYYVGSSFNAADEVQVVPSVFTKIADIGTTWPEQLGTNLYYFGYNTAPYATAGTDIHGFAGFSTGLLAISGVGDPCRYYLGDTWRLPTYLETEVMTGAAAKTWTGTWNNGTSTDSYFVCAFSGVGELKFPAVGLRNSSGGAIYNVGNFGWYWSSSVYNSGNGYDLYFSNGGVYPQDNSSHRIGFPVRCVKN